MIFSTYSDTFPPKVYAGVLDRMEDVKKKSQENTGNLRKTLKFCRKILTIKDNIHIYFHITI